MGALDNIKIGIDTPRWLQMKPLPAANAAGSCMCGDKRNDMFRDNSIYYMNTTNLYRMSDWYNGTMPLVAHGVTLGVADYMEFAPSFGIEGTIGVGSSTTKIVTSAARTAGTAITALGVNQLVRTDMHEGYRIKVIGKVVGKTEVRTVIGNTAGLTPTLYLDEPLSFTPSSNDIFEIESGIVYIVGTSAAGAGQTRYFGVAQGVVGNAGSTGITTATQSAGTILDEAYVPYDRTSGEGFLGDTATYNGGTLRCIQATASAASTITGQATGGDAGVIMHEYRNFQIRIVEDSVTPNSVGQRAIINGHSVGPSSVYTIGAAWAVQPSSSAKFVIELPNLILLQNSTQAGMLVYNYNQRTINNGTTTITANTWSTTYFNAVHAGAVAAGAMCVPSWSHEPITQTDGERLSRHSYVYFFRGAASTLDRFDIAGAVAGVWSNAVVYNNPISFTTASSGDHDAVTFLGEYAYLVAGATAIMYQFNVASPSLVPWTQLPLQSGTAAVSSRVVSLAFVPLEPIEPSTEVTIDDKIGMVYVQSHLSANLYRSDIIG